MYAEIMAAVQSVKTLNDLVKAASELKNFNDFVAAISEVNTKLMEAQSAALEAQDMQLSLTKRIGELEEEIRKMKDWDSEAKRYNLAIISPGVFAYALKQGMEHNEPFHTLCQNCFQQAQKSILRFLRNTDKGSTYICDRCRTQIDCEHRITPSY